MDQIMILRAISSLMATRDSFTLTMMLPPRADTTVMDPVSYTHLTLPTILLV